jgi:hypothetical protein
VRSPKLALRTLGGRGTYRRRLRLKSSSSSVATMTRMVFGQDILPSRGDGAAEAGLLPFEQIDELTSRAAGQT